MSIGMIIPRDGGRLPHWDEASDESTGIIEAVYFASYLYGARSSPYNSAAKCTASIIAGDSSKAPSQWGNQSPSLVILISILIPIVPILVMIASHCEDSCGSRRRPRRRRHRGRRRGRRRCHHCRRQHRCRSRCVFVFFVIVIVAVLVVIVVVVVVVSKGLVSDRC